MSGLHRPALGEHRLKDMSFSDIVSDLLHLRAVSGKRIRLFTDHTVLFSALRLRRLFHPVPGVLFTPAVTSSLCLLRMHGATDHLFRRHAGTLSPFLRLLL